MLQILLVGVGGFFGTIARFGIHSVMTSTGAVYLPLSVIAVNLIGSFLIGLLLGLPVSKINPLTYQIIATGFLGGFTTFSAFSGEAVGMLLKQQYIPAGIYISINLLGGVILCISGMFLMKSLI